MKAAGWIAAAAGAVLVIVLLLGSRGPYPGPAESEKVSTYPAPQVSAESVQREAERITVRVRSRRCQGLFAGSGVIRGEQVITNRHVIGGSREIEINTWDGSSFRARPPFEVTDRMDIGRFSFPGDPANTVTAEERPDAGEELLLAGYPRGQRLAVVEGKLSGYADGMELRNLRFDADVMIIEASIWRGDSGGPVLNTQGELVGIIYAGSFDEKKKKKTDRSETAFVIPIDEVDKLTPEDWRPVQPCQQPDPASLRIG